jgi:SAM-dependent methyltransferase
MVPESRQQSAQSRVVADYFKTTSGVGSARDPHAFAGSVAGLRRRLGSWLAVRGGDVLDLGSGTGELCRVARDAGARSVIGVNLSQEEIDFAKCQVDATFVLQDVASYLAQCPEGSVDCIFALNILEHLDKDTLVRVLEGAHRALRPGGRLVAMVPNATSPFGGMTRYWDITHQNAFTPSSVRQLSRLVGFGERAEFRECGPVPYALVSGVRYGLWQLIRLGIRAWLMVELASDKGGVYTADMMFRLTKPADRLV